MQRDVIDGVPVLWTEEPGPLEAALVFGCGARDETFRTLGVTHLVEHLAMSTLPRLHHEHNAAVDLDTTRFTCSGRPEQVARFLELVCRALGDLPMDRLEQESGVLAAEGGQVTHPTVAALLSHRYGASGPGLAPYAGPGPDRIGPQAVRDLVQRFFHAENAVLVLSGPPPAGLRLPLLPGRRPVRTAAEPLPVVTPSWREDDAHGPGLALRVDPQDPAVQMAVAVLAERLRLAARHQRGLSYHVGYESVAGGPGQGPGEQVIHLDAREGEAGQVAELLWAEAWRLAEQGPTDAELAEELAGAVEQLTSPDEDDEVAGALGVELLDRPWCPRSERLARLERVTVDQARTAFAAALRSALLVVPCGVRPDFAAAFLPEHRAGGGRRLPTDGLELRPPLLARLFSGDARAVRLRVTDRGLTMRFPGGQVHEVRYEEVVGVEARGEGRLVFGAGGDVIPVIEDLFTDLRAAVRTIDAAIPPALHYPASAYRPAEL
ncbi:hypothetical protein GCM10009665_02560 [Kitasatospora nipponensis]|uniref:Zn-dependent peptidase n=1 Tax=Kitasatospora nipponensis TaxID=258049 RepID=A0ABN1VPJ0_9ACTN